MVDEVPWRAKAVTCIFSMTEYGKRNLSESAEFAYIFHVKINININNLSTQQQIPTQRQYSPQRQAPSFPHAKQ